MDLRGTAKGRPLDLGRIQMSKLYTTPRPIKDGKKVYLFNSIPPVYHAFYSGVLSSSEGNNEDPEQSASEE